MVNQAILTADNPLADVMFGVDDTFLTRAIEAGIFEPFGSVRDSNRFPTTFARSDDLVTPIDYGDVCLNYDKAAFSDQLPPPSDLDDLIDPAYEGCWSSRIPPRPPPGSPFSSRRSTAFGEDGWQQYWTGLENERTPWSRRDGPRPTTGSSRAGRVRATDRWWSRTPRRPRPRSSSPRPRSTRPPPVSSRTAVIARLSLPGSWQARTTPVPRGQLIDFMLSTPFQETIPLTWFVFPANTEAALPAEFVEHTVIPTDPVQMDPAIIEANRQSWLEQWSDIFR